MLSRGIFPLLTAVLKILNWTHLFSSFSHRLFPSFSPTDLELVGAGRCPTECQLAAPFLGERLRTPRPPSIRSVSKTLTSGNGAQAARCRGPWGTSVPSACPQSTPGGQGVQDHLLLRRRRRSPAGASGGNVLSHKDHPSSCGCRARSERSSLLQAHPLTDRVSRGRNASLCSITKGNDKNVLPPPLWKLRNPDTIHNDKDCLSGTDNKEGSCAPNKADVQWQALW